MRNGEFDNLPFGKPIDLSYWASLPQDIRAGYMLLQNAGYAPEEVYMLKDMAELKVRSRTACLLKLGFESEFEEASCPSFRCSQGGTGAIYPRYGYRGNDQSGTQARDRGKEADPAGERPGPAGEGGPPEDSSTGICSSISSKVKKNFSLEIGFCISLKRMIGEAFLHENRVGEFRIRGLKVEKLVV